MIGIANFSFDSIANSFIVDRAKFLGAPGDRHGFVGTGMSVARAFTWRNVILQNGAELDLCDASVDSLLDDEKSWPAPGRLIIDGLSYRGLSSNSGNSVSGSAQHGPGDRIAIDSRLRWLALQPRGFHLQTYNELAKYYAGSGEDAAAATASIAKEDDRYNRLGLFGRLWGGFLGATIGYGHKPLLAFNWSVLVILVGWAAVLMGKRAGVMRLTWPENSPPPWRSSRRAPSPVVFARCLSADREPPSGALLVAGRVTEGRVPHRRMENCNSRLCP